MVIKLLVLKKRSCYFFNNSALLKDFDKTKLKIVKHDYVDQYVYHIDYVKNTNNVNPCTKFLSFMDTSKNMKVVNI